MEEHKDVAEELASIAERRGGRLSGWDVLPLIHGRRRRFIRSASVAQGQPKTVEHFRALAAEARIREGRDRLRRAWAYLVTQRGGPSADALGPEPERTIQQQCERIRRWLSLNAQELRPLQERLSSLGFDWDRAFGKSKIGADSAQRGRRLGEFLANSLPDALSAAVLVAQQRDAERRIREAEDRLGDVASDTIAAEIKDALHWCDEESYRRAYTRLCELHAKYVHLRRREELLQQLSRFAPTWAEVIRARRGIHGREELPGDPEAAWLWRQLEQELVRRAETPIQEIQRRLEQQMKQLYEITQQLVESRAWAHRIKKTKPSQRQALVGWLNTMRRLGKGKGRAAARLRAEASRLIAEAKDAVPVWIMPLPRVAEQINPTTTRFDVVIVDEASQCDILGLLALYVGDQVVIVGDHEQVSPEGVGQELSNIEQLQVEYLRDIPNAHLYDGKRSLYDIARESFGGALMLTEHFRCVPEIIEFSNRLCYGGRIRPLRESVHVPLKPHVVPYRVKGTAHNKVNEEEAQTIAALILAMLCHPAYKGKTIGVVSLVGDDQAKHIERLVRERCLDNPELERELETRRFLCGNSAQFQGDERDVVLISLVDSPRPEGPLPLRNDERFKQRFNVAASRARDQLWIVYSLDPAVDLKEGDLRRELIEFARQAFTNPEGLLRRADVEAARTESPFEREVLKWLTQRGYRVRAQWVVGCYRIDLVVEDESGRVAIECDGDRYHPIEQIPKDLQRQAILERLGWRFIRIRGSEFYRDRETTLQRVVQELERLGIHPRRRFSDWEDEDRRDKNAPSHSLADEIIRMAERIKAGESVKAADLPTLSDVSPPDRSRAPFRSSASIASDPSARTSPAVSPSPPAASVRLPAKAEPSPQARLTEDERQELRARLIEERDRLREELQDVNLRIQKSEFSFAREAAIQRSISLKAKLASIEDALRRFDTDEYGICMRCHNPIPIERLRALPSARLCVRCQAEEEVPPCLLQVVENKEQKLGRQRRW
ncbi:MAG: AAA domain-containing protein [Blastocatellia bacterium]|nr:AAA domain-containing protein [Blastocatellia bacterium]